VTIRPSVLRNVRVEDIELDRDNPRIKQWMEMYEDPTPEQIFQALGAGSDDDADSSVTFEKLRQSIVTNGGVIQPVILNETADGRLVCIEGNTRVAIYRDFLSRGKGEDWETIPALVHRGLDAAGIDAVRLQVHLVPPRGWDAYAKAKYLNYLRNEEHLPFGAIVDYAGGRQREVIESINAYEDMERYYRPQLPSDGNFDAKKFSGFVELQKPGIKEAILKSGFGYADFAQWIIDERLYPLNMVRVLPRILKHDDARKLFLKPKKDGGGARPAAAILERPDVSKALSDADIGTVARALNIRILKMPFQESLAIKQDPGGETAQELVQALENLRSFLGQLGLDPEPAG
jgi:hypothetical protein